MNIDPSQTEPPETGKPRFYELCVRYVPDYTILEDIAKNANIDMITLGKMFVHEVIHRVDAAKILLALSQYVKQTYNVETTYTLDNTRVALFPSFTELAEQHQLDLSQLSTLSGVDITTLDKMLVNEPVPVGYARLVLQAVTRLSKRNYSLNNVDVVIEEVHHG